jgi:hypothetical protein
MPGNIVAFDQFAVHRLFSLHAVAAKKILSYDMAGKQQ